MSNLTSQIDKILAKSTIKAEDRAMWESVKTKLLAYEGTLGGANGVSSEYLHDLLEQLNKAFNDN